MFYSSNELFVLQERNGDIMAKKKTVKKKTVKKNANVNPPDNKVVDYSYLLAQLKEDRDAVCKLANQLQSDTDKVNKRIDRIVEAHEKCKSLKNL